MARERASLWSMLAVSLVACSSAHHKPTEKEACAHLSAAYCTVVGRCNPDFLKVRFGDYDNCVRAEERWCPRNFLPGSNDSPTAKEACADALADVSCATFDPGDVECEPPKGTRAPGRACLDSAQCASGVCSGEGLDCGACVATSSEGEPCTGFDCAPGLQCVFMKPGPTGKCFRLPGAGEACIPNYGCDNRNYCNAGRCTPLKKAGERCNPDAVECDYPNYLWCSQAGKCEREKIAEIGQSCKYADGASVRCAHSHCDTHDDANEPKCVAFLKEGAACELTGVPCAGGLRCDEGKCTVAPLPSCP